MAAWAAGRRARAAGDAATRSQHHASLLKSNILAVFFSLTQGGRAAERRKKSPPYQCVDSIAKKSDDTKKAVESISNFNPEASKQNSTNQRTVVE